MEAAIRSVQVGQRADTASSQPPASISYQQRIPSGASPIHRPVDTPQSYSKGPQPTQVASRSAASPLSPPRQGATTNYPPFSGMPAREAPINRYVQQSPYGAAQPFRENPYARVPQVPQQVEYHRSGAISVPANISISHGPIPTSTIETIVNNVSNRPRISLLPDDRRIPNEYLPNRTQSTDPGGPPFKKLRLTDNHPQSPPPLLKVDVREPQSTGAYHPQVEAISPTPQSDPADELRATKDDLLNKISNVDLEINRTTVTIQQLQEKQASLEKTTAKPVKVEEPPEVQQPKHRSLAQKIFAENRNKAERAASGLVAKSYPTELPILNEPIDAQALRDAISDHRRFRPQFVAYLRKEKQERVANNLALAEKYTALSLQWQRRVEKVESSAKRKAKDAKNRDYFEKVFSELRKQREDKERFNRVGSRVKSEADVEEIIDGLQEQANEDKKMRSYAIIPPIMLDDLQKRYVFKNENGLLKDMETDYKEAKHVNVWTTGEKEIFREKFLQHPKNFGAIAASLDRKSAQDCVRFYYLSKKTENYKLLLRKSRQRTRSSRNPNKTNQTQPQSIVDSMTTGVTTRLQREQQQKTSTRDRGVNSTNATSSGTASSSTSRSTSPPQATVGTTTPPCSTQSDGIASSLLSSSSSSTTTTSATAMASAATTTTTTTTTSMTSVPSTEAADSSSTASTTNDINETDSTATKSPEADSTREKESIDAKCVKAEDALNGESAENKLNCKGFNGDASESKPFSESADAKPLVTTNSAANATPMVIDGAVATTTASNETNPTTTQPTTSTASSVNFVNVTILNTVNGVKTELVTPLPNKTNASTAPLSGLSNKENTAHLSNANQSLAPSNSPSSTAAAIKMEVDSDVDNKAVDSDASSATSKVALNAIKEEDTSDEIESKKRRIDTSIGLENILIADNKDKTNPCFVCKEENGTRMRPLEKGRGQQYGISDESIPSNAFVCNNCYTSSTRTRYTNCPLPTCPNPKDRVTRFRNLPARLFDLAPEIRDPVIQEFQIPSNVTKCCSACLIRIKRKLGPHLPGTSLTEEEIVKFKSLLQEIGPKWSQLAETLGKTAVALKSFYFHYKKKYAFDLAVTEYYKSHPSEERHTPITDGDESDLSTSSGDELEGGSDTASVGSSKASLRNQTSLTAIKKEDSAEMSMSAVKDERLIPPVSQPPRKIKSEEYDSSATETADEENEASPGNRHSPKVLLYPNQTTITMVPTTTQNGPRDNSELNVRDVMLDVIERSLKTNQLQQPPKPSIPKPNLHDSRNDITFVREYRNDIGKPHHISSLASVTPAPSLSRSSNQDGLATLSVVNSLGHTQQILHPLPISSQIAATITPVHSQSIAPGQNQQQSISIQSSNDDGSMNHMHLGGSLTLERKNVHDMPKDNVVVYSQRGDEPQTLDLSIKKPPRESFPPPAHPKPMPGGNVTMYRSDPHSVSQQSIMNANQGYLSMGYHEQHGRPSKSPSMYMPNVPTSLAMSQQPPMQSQHSRGHQQQPVHTQSMPQHQSTITQSKSKTNPKLSPKTPQHASNSQQGGPKGSITHGTPVNSNNQPILIQTSGPATLSPRFDGIGMRQTPPSGDKLGSITQGTPVHLPPHHLTDKQRVYDYTQHYKNSRQSPAHPPQQPSPQQAFGTPYQARGPTGPYIEPLTPMSSRQIIMNDFITSQQMHGQSRGRSDKESPSPRSASVSGSPAAIYYAEKDQRQRAEFLSRASPAEHINSTPSPHRTPPPQRQGVIQRHNTGGSKPPSPAPSRIHMMPQHHYPSGHDAFSSLVDVAVQQPLLPVPHKDDKRPNVSVNDHTPPMHHEMRYHHAVAAAHEQMAMQMHQQQMRQQAELQRRHQQQQTSNAYQMERDRQERDKERERERERMERERDRVNDEQNRREAAKLAVLQYPREGQNVQQRDNRPGRPQDGNLTAASLIDAIITHQINQTATEPPPRETHRPQYFPGRELHPENNGKMSSPNVINIDLDSDRGRNSQLLTKNITIGELTDSIITKDYSPHPLNALRPPMQYRLETNDVWKFNRSRMTPKDGPPPSMPPTSVPQMPPSSVHSQNKGPTNPKMSVHEISRSSSPRTSAKQYHESITPPEMYSYAQSATHARLPSQQPPAHPFIIDCYVKNRIVEAMRTEDDKRSDDISEQQRRTPQQSQSSSSSSSAHHGKDVDRSSTPGDMIIDEDGSSARPSRPPSSVNDRKEWPAFAPATYAYAFNALTVSGALTNLPTPIKTPHIENSGGGNGGEPVSRNQTNPVPEPKPLLSAQYEALSDED